jgi:mono/diheme cytochrome c family protein
MSSRHAVSRLVAVVALVGGLAAAPPAIATDEATEWTAEGRRLYLRWCASCHGAGGRGDGAVAPALGEPPADLTRLAQRNGGEFSVVAVFSAIDGTTMPRAHGVSEMPVWGQVLRDAPGDAHAADAVEKARDAILAITDYVRTLQRP